MPNDNTGIKGPTCNWERMALLLVLVISLWRAWIMIFLPISKDEAYYWVWSRYLDMGFYDHPPLIAWLIALGTEVGGNGIFGVRITALLASFFCFGLVYRLNCILFQDKRAGFLAIVIMNLLPLLEVGGIIVGPDTPLVVFWGAAMHSLSLAYTDKKLGWIGCGIALGLALLSKLTAILFIPCTFLWLLSTAKGRDWLKTPWPYVACLIALVIFSPFLLWNANHEWVSFIFQIRHGFHSNHNWVHNTAIYLGGQLLVATPIFFVLAIIFWIRALRPSLSENNQYKTSAQFLTYFSLPIFLFFLYSGLQSGGQPNWPAPAYFALSAALGRMWSEALRKKSSSLVRWFNGGIIYAGIMSVIFYIIMYSPHLASSFPNNRISNEFLGWENLANQTKNYIRNQEIEKIFAPSYQIASLLAFYGIDPQLMEVVSQRQTQYNLWAKPKKETVKNAIYITYHDSPIDEKILNQYQSIDHLPLWHIQSQGKPIRKMNVIKLSNPKSNPLESEKAHEWDKPKVGIVIPTYNEKENLLSLLNEIRIYLPHALILIVDDSSPDGTGKLADQEAAKNPCLEVLHRPNKLGLGSAYIEGFQKMLQKECQVIIQMDCDFSHHPAAIPQLIKELANADVVVGSRYMLGGRVFHRDYIRELISRLGSTYAATILNLPYSDLTSGFKAWRATALKPLLSNQILSKGFGFQIEMTYRSHQAGLQITEVPIQFHDRQQGNSKLNLFIILEALYVCSHIRLLSQ